MAAVCRGVLRMGRTSECGIGGQQNTSRGARGTRAECIPRARADVNRELDVGSKARRDRRVSVFDIFPERVGEFCTVLVEDAAGGAFDLFNEAVKIVAGAGDGNNAEGGWLPGEGFIQI